VLASLVLPTADASARLPATLGRGVASSRGATPGAVFPLWRWWNSFPGVEFRILGRIEVLKGTEIVPLGGPRQRLVLVHLLLRRNRAVSQEQLIDDVWGECPPPAARSSLQSYVSHLRTALGPERLEGGSRGYVLRVAVEELDAARFESLIQEAKHRAASDPAMALEVCVEALGLWRGPAFDDLSGEPSLQPEIARLEELRLIATEERIATQLALGRHEEVVAELQELIARHPLRERLWEKLMIALYRAGRQAEALETYRRARTMLADELGLDPSVELRRLERQILQQRPANELGGTPLRGYRLLERIGAGAFGEVHRALQPDVEREVAVKAIRRSLANHPEFIRRFSAEAQLVARLEHPHIVPLYDFWREPDGAYLVMRYFRGGSLREALARGPLDIDRTVALIDQVAQALTAAHRQGVVHRDVKPANILFDAEGNAYLSDFGIAKDLAAATAAGRGGTLAALASYLSPEEARGESTTAAADIYNLGVVVFESLAGRHPFADTPPEALVEMHAHEPLPPLRSLRPEIPEAIDGVVAVATAKNPSERYPDALALAAAFRESLAPGVATVAVATLEARNPYKGLRPFLEADASDFFGRAALVEELVHLVGADANRSGFLCVVGPSGSGKSSAMRAGLVPAIRLGVLPGSERWFVVEMHPGARPFEELAASLTRIAAHPTPGLLEELEQDDAGLLRAADEVLAGDGSELMLVIDQFEELFTLVDREDVRARFLAAVLRAATDDRSRVRIIVALRADFYDRALSYPGLAEVVKTRTVTVTPLNPAELERAVSGPAERVGMRVDPAVVAAVAADIGAHPTALPLLQYALTELFENRTHGTLTLDAYHRIGGISGALARRAEELYATLDDAGKEATRQLFLRLVTLGDEGSEDTRRSVPRSELTSVEADTEAMEAAIDAFGSRRFLAFDRDPVSRAPTVEVAHEALLREWGRLHGWIDAARTPRIGGSRRRRRAMVAVALVLAAVAGGAVYLATIETAPTLGSAERPITIVTPWFEEDPEQQAFYEVLRTFEQTRGLQTDVRAAGGDFQTVMRRQLDGGDLPTISFVSPGLLPEYVRQGLAKPLEALGIGDDALLENYAKSWVDLARVHGKVYGLPTSATSKSLVWYRPREFRERGLRIPHTWDELLSVTKRLTSEGEGAWAVGAADSFTLTDWFENIYIRTEGPRKYDALFAGKLPFDDPSVIAALGRMTSLLHDASLAGGIDGALGTSFPDAVHDMFGAAPSAHLLMEGGFVGSLALADVRPPPVPGRTIGTSPFPTIDATLGNPVIVGADFVVSFVEDDEIGELLLFLASPGAGRIWVSTGTTVSPNRRIPLSAYPNSLVRTAARQVTSARDVRFDGSDLLPGALAADLGSTLQEVVRRPHDARSLMETFQRRAARAFNG